MASASAQPDWFDDERHVEARILSDMEVVAPGQDFHIGFHQVMDDGWHTYWRNGGDAGEPIEVEWDLPDGVTAGEMVWPVPKSKRLADTIMDYLYEGEVTLPVRFHIAEDYAGSSLTVRADAMWLVCSDVCIPEAQSFELTLQVDDVPREHPDDVWYIRAALESEPQRADEIDASLSRSGETLVLALSGGVFSDPSSEWRELSFYPFDSDLIEHAPPQTVDSDGERTLLLLTPAIAVEHDATMPRGGLLNYEVYRAGAWMPEHVEILAEPSDEVIAVAVSGAAALSGGMWAMIVFAFLGGLILNLMPCVFPILTIKVVNIVETAHDHPRRVRRHGLYFMAGVVSSFVLLAGLLVLLREFGLPVGWGFQLQVPVVVAVLAVLLFGIGLNLMGVFEVGTSLQGLGQGLADKPGGRAAFFTGVLAVVVAAPCVGPLAAGALGAALTQPTIVVLLVAAAMGLGLALPFVVFAFMPDLLRFLPRPGPWMTTFKQVLAFPMFASAIWLVWVLSIQTGSAGVLFVLNSMLALGLAVWAAPRAHFAWKLVALVAVLGMLTSTIWVSRLPSAMSTQTLAANEEPWSRERVASLRTRGKAVFVDVTAAWCVTCQVNKIRVLDDDDVQAAFERHGVVILRADWTNRNDEIAALIAEHGQAGVPLYLLYPADGGAPRVLPTVLDEGSLIEALAEAAGGTTI